MSVALPITSLVPVRKTPSDKAEMTTQVLFGQYLDILEEIQQWDYIRIRDDGYEGWVDKRMLVLSAPLDEETDKGILPWFLPVREENETTGFMLPPGSTLYRPDMKARSFQMGSKTYFWEGAYPHLPQMEKADSVCSLAERFLGSPYCWGGKNPFGIDCSGLVQLLFAIHRIPLPRDAREQSTQGKEISFIQESRKGDLAFFGERQGSIQHVGILTGDGYILHASGSVRKDRIDQEGIFVQEFSRYSHSLKLIRRIIP